MEETDYSMLFRWFVCLSLDEAIWSPMTFSRNRDRLLAADVASAFVDAVWPQADAAGLLSDEHVAADSTLLEAWASLKSFRRTAAASWWMGSSPSPAFMHTATVLMIARWLNSRTGSFIAEKKSRAGRT